jgi:hypothetical protein
MKSTSNLLAALVILLLLSASQAQQETPPAPSTTTLPATDRQGPPPARGCQSAPNVLCLPSPRTTPGPAPVVAYEPISAEDLKMTSEPLAPGAPAIILYRQVDRDDGSDREDDYYRIKILTDEGRKQADVEIPFWKGYDEVLHIRARTTKPDGSKVDFDGQVFEKSLVKARGLQVLAKTFTLSAVEPGCVIEYSYSLQLKHNYASHWIVSENLFTKQARFTFKPYKGGSTVYYRTTWEHLPSGVSPQRGPDRTWMDVSNIAAFQTEDFMPPPNELKSRVDFNYQSSLISGGDQYWKLVGQVRNAQLEKFIGKRKTMEQAVAQIVQPNDPPEVKLRKIFDRVQHLRNTSFELRKTQQEEKRDKEKFDENVEDVWKRGYGTPWQLDWLYVALARAAGFEAYGCWVSSRAEYFFTPVTMQAGHLSEPAVLVKLNGNDLYLNPGSEFAPYGMLNWSETAVRGMRLDKDDGTWIVTSMPESSESVIQRSAKLKLSESGDLEGKLTVTYTGLEAMDRRTKGLHADEVAWKKTLEDEVKRQIPLAAEAELTNHPDWSNSEAPFVAEFRLKVPNWALNAGKRTALPTGIFVAHEKNIFEHADRVHPIYFEYPYQELDDITIELPEGWKANGAPPVQAGDIKVVSYKLQVENHNETVHVVRKLNFDFMLVEQKDYQTLRRFFQSVRSSDDEQILLQPGAASASN